MTRTAQAGAGAAAVALLVGCSLQPGKAAVEDFQDWYAANPIAGVTFEEGDANEVLPGVGNATVLLHGDAGVDLEAVRDHLCGYPNGQAPTYFDLAYDTAGGGTVTTPLPCPGDGPATDPNILEHARAYETLDGLAAADVREDPNAQFVNAASLRRGATALDGHYATRLVVSTDGLYVQLDARADVELNRAALAVTRLSPGWPVARVHVNYGTSGLPDTLTVVTRGKMVNRLRVEVEDIVKGFDLPSDAKVHVIAG